MKTFKNKKILIKYINMVLKSKIYLIFILAFSAFLAFNVSFAWAAECDKHQPKFSFSSFLNPFATLAEKVAKNFGYEVALATAPDPDACGSDNVVCADYKPQATISWAAPTVDGVNWQSWAAPYYYLLMNCSTPLAGDACFSYYQLTVGNKSYIIYPPTTSYIIPSSDLADNTAYNWSVDAVLNDWCGGGTQVLASGCGVTGLPSGSFRTPECDPDLVVDIKANGSDGPINIPYGGSAQITWCGSPSKVCANAGSCSVSPDGWGGVSGTMPTGALINSRTYTLTCANPSGRKTATDSVRVDVGSLNLIPDFKVDIKASGSDELAVSSGDSATITWCGSPANSCSNATSCSVSPGNWSGLSGTKSTGNLTSSQTYTLSCEVAGAVINDNDFLTGVMLSHSGLGGFNAQNILDHKPGTNGWYADVSSRGSWLKIDLGPGNGRGYLKARIYADRAGDKGNYSIQYSDTGGSGNLEWKDAAAGFIPSQKEWNEKNWSDVGSHRYWRLYLTNTPGIGAWLTELELYKKSVSDSVSINVGSLQPTLNSTYVIAPSSAAVEINKTQQFQGWYDPDGPSGSQAEQKVTAQASWTSSNTGIATINTIGLAICKASGSATITSVYKGITATVSLICASVSVPTVDLQINNSAGPVNISYNTSANITWSSTNANSCTASGGTWAGQRPVSGSESTGNLTVSQTYNLACSGPGGSIQKSVIVNVSAPPPSAPTLDFNVSVSAGNAVTLSWSSTNTTSCAASGAWSGSKPVSGSESAGVITTTTTYTLNCAGPGGSAQSSVTVNRIN